MTESINTCMEICINMSVNCFSDSWTKMAVLRFVKLINDDYAKWQFEKEEEPERKRWQETLTIDKALTFSGH